MPRELTRLSWAYLEEDQESARAELAAYADSAPNHQVAAWTRLVLGYGDYRAERYDVAAEELKQAVDALAFGEYAAFYLAMSLHDAERFAEAAASARPFTERYPKSRFAPRAAQLVAESLIRDDRRGEARTYLDSQRELLSNRVRWFLLARINELDGNLLEAVKGYRRAYYKYPLSSTADDAEKALNRLRGRLGNEYPKAPSQWRLERADVLYDAGKYGQAGPEYSRALPGLSGASLQHARLRAATSDYHRIRTTAAYTALTKLSLDTAEQDAERLYYLGECARRLRRLKEFSGGLEELAGKHPESPWLEEALFSRGNFYLLKNDGREYRRYYDRSFRSFPNGKYGAKAHWKVCWRAYLDGDPRARSLFEEHIRLYPSSPQTSASIYWLARISEADGDPDAAVPMYSLLSERYPNYYYAALARDRLIEMGRPPISQPAPIDPTKLPGRRTVSPQASSATEEALFRGRLLFDLALADWAEEELSAMNYRAADGHLIGLELARQCYQRGKHHQGLRYLKRYGYGYLRFPIESMPREFWERLYPLPWDSEVRSRARRHRLDPHVVAGLIRQESEFNPRARSRAGALGLMQIMPATGRILARRLGISNYSTRLLYRPELSLRLGTFYMKDMAQQFENHIECVLAGYNAGEHRVEEWITWGDFSEPASFVETIPFTQTRGYVQAVLRNADMYRRLYGPSAEVAEAR